MLLILQSSNLFASACQAPSHGFIHIRLRESFHGPLAETELKEWMTHPKNQEVRQSLKVLDQKIKFSPQRLEREDLLDESQLKFEQAIQNTGRPTLMDNFPAEGTRSLVSGGKGVLSIVMSKLKKGDLDFMPKTVLDKLEPKVKVNYFFPYDKFEYFLTYDGKELPIEAALIQVQKDMEKDCELRRFDNVEQRFWYKKTRGVEYPNASGSSGSSGAKGE